METERGLRQQYYFRESPGGLLAWDVNRLIALTRDMPRRQIPLSQIREIEEPWFAKDETPSWRSLVEHLRLVEAADLSYPIILAADGSVMDGMHRVAKALRAGRQSIEAVQFPSDPPPDYVGRRPEDLPY